MAEPEVRRQALGAALRRYREDKGLDSTKVSLARGWDRDKLSRLENGDWRRDVTSAVTELAKAYELSGPQLQELLQLAEAGTAQGFREKHRGVFPGPYVEFERSAVGIDTYQSAIIHGLLQTREYAEAVISAGGFLSEREIRRRVAAREDRQELLSQPEPPKISMCLDETALWRPVGGQQVMNRQIRHLIELAGRPSIEIRIIPNEIGAYPAMGMPFTYLRFREGAHSPRVHIELPTNPLLIAKLGETGEYAALYERIISCALTPEDSVERMARLIERGEGE